MGRQLRFACAVYAMAAERNKAIGVVKTNEGNEWFIQSEDSNHGKFTLPSVVRSGCGESTSATRLPDHVTLCTLHEVRGIPLFQLLPP